MSELRKDPVIERWVIIATERNLKPNDFDHQLEIRKKGPCVFCEGMEMHTPEEIFSVRDSGTSPNQPGWRVRVVPNKFPALRLEETFVHSVERNHETLSGLGAHEVIIETPDHYLELTDLPEKQIYEILLAYRERMRDLKKDTRLRYCVIFKNQGVMAGASIQHAHSQIIAIPVVPKRVKEELQGADAYFQKNNRCIFCDILQQDKKEAKRIITQNDHFISFIPYASRFPYEIWILPFEHSAHFIETGNEALLCLAELLKQVLLAVKKALNNPPYNLILHVAPYLQTGEEGYNQSFHWHIEVLPSLTKVAGFEWGTGFYINPVIPEEAVEILRKTVSFQK
ncbi:MAG: galactose-1-phosphate uridylyltransferase [Atribacterota bacterium]